VRKSLLGNYAYVAHMLDAIETIKGCVHACFAVSLPMVWKNATQLVSAVDTHI